MTEGPEFDTTLFFIPEYIQCPTCKSIYNTLNVLNYMLFPEIEMKCSNCKEYIFTNEYVAKFVGVIKDVDIHKEVK
jgi:hypothetical protein